MRISPLPKAISAVLLTLFRRFWKSFSRGSTSWDSPSNLLRGMWWFRFLSSEDSCGREGEREGERKGVREGVREGEREGVREGEREVVREGDRKGVRE